MTDVEIVKDACRQVEDIVLALPSHNREQFLNVLSALRGEDSEDNSAKDAGTNWVRAVAFPRLCSLHVPGVPWWVIRSQIPDASVSKFNHYRDHIKWAFEALGIRSGVKPT